MVFQNGAFTLVSTVVAAGTNIAVTEDLLDDVKVTAERVDRFATDVERDSSVVNRKLWRAALADFRDAVRRARARGYETQEIQDHTRDLR